MSSLQREDWLSFTPKDILHVWKYDEESGPGRKIVLYPIDFNQLGDAEAAAARGEESVTVAGYQVTLNNTGALIWELCDGTHSIGEIVIAISERFPDVDMERIKNDVRKFFERLEPFNVLEVDWSPM